MDTTGWKRFGNRLGILTAFVLLGGIGCDSGPVTGTVKGTVTYQGKPVGNARINFVDDAHGVSSNVATNTSGEYTLPDALPIGEYAVDVGPLIPDDPANQKSLPALTVKLPPKVLNTTTSGIKFTINKGVNEFNLEIQD